MRKIICIVLSWCLASLGFAQDNPFGNALVPDMIADASIERIGDTFYCYATTDGYGRHLDTSGPPVVWKSRDFVHWWFDGTYFPSAKNEKYWAPSKAVKAKNGKWYIYPTVNGYMYAAVADSPDGPFRIARGVDKFETPYTKGGTLLQTDDPGGIDAEVFIDDDGQAYIYWGRFYAGRLADDMMTVTDITTFDTPHHVYSEGPGFFKRNGIYYYYYTLGGDERYQYAYMMSRTSPLGPWEAPKEDIITTTNVETGVFGPGHGCVFNNGDDWYFAFLEFGRRSTNRQTYVCKMEFNDDGTIKPVQVDLKGVGALAKVKWPKEIEVKEATASSVRQPMRIAHNQDERCQRTEHFAPAFAIDKSNGSRWMPATDERNAWLQIDLGAMKTVGMSEIYFVRPTAGHTYTLLGSTDGENWTKIGGQDERLMHSPCSDTINKKLRYLRVITHDGEAGVWEWNVYEHPTPALPTREGVEKSPSTKNPADKSNNKTPSLEGRAGERPWGDWTAWGDRGDGTYRNPIIPSDYSDLDCIQVGEDYYAISSTFQFSPGMTILHSRDLVNWDIAGGAVSDLTQIGPELDWTRMNRYGLGIWAGTLRHHDGRFHLFFGTPDEGFFTTSATDVRGEWEPLTCLLPERGWDDCTAFWDERTGKAWFVGTHFADNYKTYLMPMASDGLSINTSKARLINEGSGREASKIIKHGEYYYLIFSEHKNGIGRYVMAKRTKALEKGFSEERQLALASVDANEPNQGGIVKGVDGQWYFLTHHGSGDWSGRIVSLLPVTWIDGWPIIGGVGKGCMGEMAWAGKMPTITTNEPSVLTTNEPPVLGDSFAEPRMHLQRSDDFDNETLAPQWQWNYQPRTSHFSLTERPGWLRLKAFKPLENDRLMKAGNTLTARVFRAQHNCVTIKLDISGMADGQRCGLCHFSAANSALGIAQENGKRYLEYRNADTVEKVKTIETVKNIENVEHPVLGDSFAEPRYIWLRSEWGLDGLSTYSYSLDGDTFHPVATYQLQWGNYRGDRYGIYCFNNATDEGFVDIDYCHYDIKK